MVGFAWCCCGETSTTIVADIWGNWNPGISSTIIRKGSNELNVGFDAAATEIASFIMYPSVAVPQGATIASATLEIDDAVGTVFSGLNQGAAFAEDFVAGEIFSKTARFTVAAEDVDNATEHTTVSALDGATRTSASTAVTMDTETSSGAGNQTMPPGSVHTVADITSVIQEVVDRLGWSSGNTLTIFVDDNGSDNKSTVVTWGTRANLTTATHAPNPCPDLVINYT